MMLVSLPAPPPMSCPARLYIYRYYDATNINQHHKLFMIIQFLSSIGSGSSTVELITLFVQDTETISVPDVIH